MKTVTEVCQSEIWLRSSRIPEQDINAGGGGSFGQIAIASIYTTNNNYTRDFELEGCCHRRDLKHVTQGD